MKTKTLLKLTMILVLFSTEIHSQNNWHVVDTIAKWNVLKIVHYPPSYYTQIIKFVGQDTVINSVPYKKVEATYDENEENWFFMDLMIREDTINRQVFLRDLAGNEGLIYDFSAGVGDVVEIANPLSGGVTVQMEVITVDEVLINGELRKRIALEDVYSSVPDVWVEGIGSLNKGIIYPGYNLTGQPVYSLLCYKYDNTVYYMHPDYDDCYYTFGVGVEELVDNYKVFYNRESKCIEIENSRLNNLTYFSLYSAYGQKIFSKSISNNEQINLSNYQLSGGLYIYSIKSKSNYYSGKLIITNK
ncbi:MAG: T9SS type A sorting domain-containing protein [Bacteroidota bacterium]|nr:T9SS type A sorting domain-containing protein [Bacteroidota bacterium]